MGAGRNDYAVKRFERRSGALTPMRREGRLILVAAAAVIWSLALVGRLYYLQFEGAGTWNSWASRQHLAEVKVAGERGPILDRQGRFLALSVPSGSVYVHPRQVIDRKRTAAELSKLLEIPQAEVAKKLESNKSFVWIRRQIPREQAQRADSAKLPGVGSMLEPKRVYPYGHAAGTVIGKVGIDGNGLSGVERAYDKYLVAESESLPAVRDALGKLIQSGGGNLETEFEPPKGAPLRLTIDAELQAIVDEEIAAAKKETKAEAVMAVMVDADSGEILALSQAPGIDLNSEEIPDAKWLRNLVAETVFEPGSIMKPLVAAAALDARLVKSSELIDCENGRLPVGRHIIKDVHPSEVISFHDVVVRSSNIGMTKVGMRLGPQRLYQALRDFGLGRNTDLGLPGESAGILRSVESWAKVDVATHSFGQGVAVTPLQMVRAFSAVANGGRLPELKLVEDGKPYVAQRIISERAAAEVREMLFGVVEDKHGTGSKAVIGGVRVGGKTGTAQKARRDGRGYEAGSYIASFVGFADAAAVGVERRLTLMVLVDEPNTTSIYGGTLAAPVFRKIMTRALHLVSTQKELHSPDLPMVGEPSQVVGVSYHGI